MTIYSNLLEAIQGLKAEGYTEDFNLKEECIECGEGAFRLYHDDFVIDKYFRFDVDSDAADQSIIYAISSDKVGLKGILINAYGLYAEPMTDEMVEKLKIA